MAEVGFSKTNAGHYYDTGSVSGHIKWVLLGPGIHNVRVNKF